MHRDKINPAIVAGKPTIAAIGYQPLRNYSLTRSAEKPKVAQYVSEARILLLAAN